MVDDHGQLYTIEGIAAGMIMLFTTYLVLNATSVYTPGDTHISDMQLEQIGTDALRMMNTPLNGSLSESPLQDIIEYSGNGQYGFDNASFNTMFTNYVNNRTGSAKDNLHYYATVTYYNLSSQPPTTGSLFLASNRNLKGGEHPVRVTEWVLADKTLPGDSSLWSEPQYPIPRAVLVEVLLWRD
jgi:hypothetical protein